MGNIVWTAPSAVVSCILLYILWYNVYWGRVFAWRLAVWAWRLKAARAAAAGPDMPDTLAELRVTMRLRRCGGSAFRSTAAFTCDRVELGDQRDAALMLPLVSCHGHPTGEAHCIAQGLNLNPSGDVQNDTNALYRIDAHSA